MGPSSFAAGGGMGGMGGGGMGAPRMDVDAGPNLSQPTISLGGPAAPSRPAGGIGVKKGMQLGKKAGAWRRRAAGDGWDGHGSLGPPTRSARCPPPPPRPPRAAACGGVAPCAGASSILESLAKEEGVADLDAPVAVSKAAGQGSVVVAGERARRPGGRGGAGVGGGRSARGGQAAGAGVRGGR